MIFVLGSSTPSVLSWLVPFAGSVLLFIGAMITLWRTNRAADRRAEIARQNERERDFRLWQRDTLLRLGFEVVEAAVDAHGRYFDILMEGYEPDEKPLKQVDRAVQQVHAAMVRFQLMGASETAERCQELHGAINPTRGLGDKIIETYKHEGDTITAALHGQSDAHEARRKELGNEINEMMLDIYSKRDAFVESVERELARTKEPTSSSAAYAS